MRNGEPTARREKGGSTTRAYVKPLNPRKLRRTAVREALVVLDTAGGYRRLTPEHAERVARELLAAAEEARRLLAGDRGPEPDPPAANAAVMEAA